MTPPPMTTTWARSGSPLDVSVVTSVVPRGLLEQALELRTVELGHGPVVLLHRPLPEVEVDRADRALDRAPERPAVLRHQSPQPGPGDAVPEQSSVVRLHQLVELLGAEVGLAPEVAELEAGVVVAGVLVVDQPQLVAVVDEVAGEEVVVARHGPRRVHRQRPADVLRLVGELLVALGEPEPVLVGDGEVARLDLEHVEVVDEPRSVMELPAGGRDPGEVPAGAEVLVGEGVALDEPDDEQTRLLDVLDDRGADPRVR